MLNLFVNPLISLTRLLNLVLMIDGFSIHFIFLPMEEDKKENQDLL